MVPAVHRALLAGLADLPAYVPLALAALGIGASLAVLADAFRPLVVLPLTAALLAGMLAVAPRTRGVGRGEVLAGVVAVAVAVLWVVVNLPFVAEYVIVYRDPGFLALQAIWLETHHQPEIPVCAAETAAAALGGAASAGSTAFALHDGALQVQGTKMLPGVLAAVGWLGGSVLAANLAVGAGALLAVHGLARQLLGSSWWALVPMVGLATSLPFLTFTRSPYTEPFALAMVAAGLMVAVRAVDSGRAREHALAGALVGAGAAARIDGALAVLALLVALGLIAAVSVRPAGARRGLLAAAATAVPLTALGYLDVRVQSRTYLAEHLGQMTTVLGATAVALLLALAVAQLPLSAALLRRRRLLAGAASTATVATAALLATRPLWLVERNIAADSPVAGMVQVLQTSEGLAVDPFRSYDELSVSWLGWYVGWHVVALGFVGLAWMLADGIRRMRPAPFFFAAVVLGASAYYLVRVSITPDQIWAVRRLLPVTVPALLVAATWAVLTARRRALELSPGRSAWPSVVAGALALSIAVFPAAQWDGLQDEVEHEGRHAEALAACDALAAAGLQRVVWVHSAAFRYLGTLRVICDVEVVELTRPPSADQLVVLREAWGGGEVGLLTFHVDSVLWSSRPSAPVHTMTTQVMQRPITHRPFAMDESESSLWLGTIGSDGRVDPVE